jgi:hypothetical protein
MMNEYTPDRWVMLEITGLGSEPIRKIFAGWYGGYLGSDSWKLNSGVTDICIDDSGHYEFEGYSGSTYYCHANTHGMSGYMFSVLTSWRNMYPHVEFKEIELEMIVES